MSQNTLMLLIVIFVIVGGSLSIARSAGVL